MGSYLFVTEKCIRAFSEEEKKNLKTRSHLVCMGTDMKMILKLITEEIGYESVNWIYVAQDGEWLRALLNTK